MSEGEEAGEAVMLSESPGYGGWEEVGDEPMESSAILKAICKTRFKSRHHLSQFLNASWGSLQMALTHRRRPSIRVAKRYADKLGAPEYYEAVVREHSGPATCGNTHQKRWATSMEIETYRNLYNFYQKALRSGISPPGDVHHEMGKIYRRLKKAGEVG